MKHDVIVVGAGAVGLCCAHFLAARGASVLVLDRDPPGRSASNGNGGWIVSSHLVPLAAPKVVAQGLLWLLDRRSPFWIRPRPRADLVRWLLAFRRLCTQAHVDRAAPLFRDLNALSHDHFRDFAERWPFGYAERGLLDVHEDPASLAKGVAAAERLRADHGLVTEALSAADVAAMEPTLKPAAGGLFHPQDAHIDPSAYMAVLREQVVAAGVEVRHGAAVTHLVHGGGRVRAVRVGGEELEAEQVVLAAGVWTKELLQQLGVRTLLEGAKGYSLTAPGSEGFPTRPVRMAEAKVAFTPMTGRVRLAGTIELAGLDLSVTTSRVAGIVAGARRYLATDHPWERETPWAGLRPATPDGFPYLGRPRGWSNVIVAAGHATVGITLSPATGHLVAQLADGEAPDVASPLLEVDRYG